MNEIADYMLDFVEEYKMSKEQLLKIQIPKNIVYEIPFVDEHGFEITLTLYDYLSEIEDVMNSFLWEELYYRDKWDSIEQVKLSALLKEFSLPLCPFWLTFCEMVKMSFSEHAFS